MLVVDRREDVSAYPLGTIRSEAQHEQDPSQHTQAIEKIDKVDITDQSLPHPGVPTIYKTPGPDALLEFLFKRVWGVQL